MSCQSNKVSFDSFDSPRWISETSACEGYRASVIAEMEDEFDKFMGMSETEVLDYLGSPTKKLLYTRGQKFLSYDVDCTNNSNQSRKLRIRFSALNYVNEVLVLD
ncbi:MAG: hypothetical protein ABJH98_10840 [Reichenbachiella sp.]